MTQQLLRIRFALFIAVRGRVDVSNNKMASADEYYDLNEDSRAEQLRHAELLRKYEAQKRGRNIALPTTIGS